jgi:hypothetical protein
MSLHNPHIKARQLTLGHDKTCANGKEFFNAINMPNIYKRKINV